MFADTYTYALTQTQPRANRMSSCGILGFMNPSMLVYECFESGHDGGVPTTDRVRASLSLTLRLFWRRFRERDGLCHEPALNVPRIPNQHNSIRSYVYIQSKRNEILCGSCSKLLSVVVVVDGDGGRGGLTGPQVGQWRERRGINGRAITLITHLLCGKQFV